MSKKRPLAVSDPARPTCGIDWCYVHKLERVVKFHPAYDRRSPDPQKNYGIHGVELRMVLKGLEGAVVFALYTNWMLPPVTRELDGQSGPVDRPHVLCRPQPADLGYHSLVQRHDGQKPTDNCEYLGGRPCYYDGSGMRAYDVYRRLLERGDEGVWQALECEYKRLFTNEHVESACVCAKADAYREIT